MLVAKSSNTERHFHVRVKQQKFKIIPGRYGSHTHHLVCRWHSSLVHIFPRLSYAGWCYPQPLLWRQGFVLEPCPVDDTQAMDP